tara:strand:- start:98 stop:337 length:240 start_codon:yes stop_codon:yes gene_type:complete
VGDLVRWNRWHSDSDWIKVDGYMVFEKHMKSHLGIILRVYQSTSKARCWVADVNFMDSVRNYQDEPEYSVPLSCLQVIE